MLDVEKIRRDFPILQRRVHGKPLVWLDNAATTQKPQSVIGRITRFYEHENSNTHSGIHALALEAADAYEGARAKVAAFLNAAVAEEIVFVRGTTEGLNLLAAILGEAQLQPDDEILLTQAEHHSNIVPWQIAAKKTGAVIRVAPMDDNGDIILEEYERLIGPRTRIATFTHVSNALGSVLPVAEMAAIARRAGATVVIDGAQGVPHRRVDVRAIDCDFYVFSGHKLFGPTGIGAVYGRKALWEALPPWQTGGGMIDQVTFEKTTFADPPWKFEPGTCSLAGAIALGTAIDYVNSVGMEAIEAWETQLLAYAGEGLRSVPGLRMVGNPRERGGLYSITLPGIADARVGKLLDEAGIAVRTGAHCAQPILARFGLTSTVRPSFSLYNTREEVDLLVETLRLISAQR
ncbi:MAG TPA: SufS family cysteine desulfurase [Gallionellaceae bacterium]|nr:SufS family cysteine desulfurase [Gallionellaceae bacterium]